MELAWDDPDRRDAALRRAAQRLGEVDPLSRHEVAVLFLLSHGVPRGLIAEWLHLAATTVDDQVKLARAKLFAATTAHAVAQAIRLGIIE